MFEPVRSKRKRPSHPISVSGILDVEAGERAQKEANAAHWRVLEGFRCAAGCLLAKSVSCRARRRTKLQVLEVSIRSNPDESHPEPNDDELATSVDPIAEEEWYGEIERLSCCVLGRFVKAY